MLGSSFNKIINYILKKNIKSCERIISKILSLKEEIREKIKIIEASIEKECNDTLEYFSKKTQSDKYNSKIEKLYNTQKAKANADFTKKLNDLEAKILLSDKTCLSDAILSYENRALDTLNKCVVASLDNSGLSGCENYIKSFSEECD